MSRFGRHLLSAGVAVALAASATAQILPPVSLPPVSLPPPVTNVPVVGPVVQGVITDPQSPQAQQVQQAIRPSLNRVTGLPESIAEAGPATLLELRRLRLQELIKSNRTQLESDGTGLPVRRGIVVVSDPDPLSLQRALAFGFRPLADDRHPELGMRIVQLAVPLRMNAREGLQRLRTIAPHLNADLDHIYEPAGGQLGPLQVALASSTGAGGRGIGMIDGGVASHPSLSRAAIEQSGFAGSPQPTGHGTAVASLLVGDHGRFSGGAVGARLFVADVYGGNSAAGSASAVVKALGWLVRKRAQVINVSLVGPPNAMVRRAVDSVRARGIQIVAAVGNDGPAAPPQYPASYPGVTAITGVDGRGRALPEAGRAAHIDFAAPGADMAAALPGEGYARVRGTSFAAPLAAARLAIVGSTQALAAEARPGRGKVGRGIVCSTCRVEPRAVRAK